MIQPKRTHDNKPTAKHDTMVEGTKLFTTKGELWTKARYILLLSMVCRFYAKMNKGGYGLSKHVTK